MLGLLFEIILRCYAIDFGQGTCVKHFIDYEVFGLLLLASFFLICVDHVEDLHSPTHALLAIFYALLKVYVLMIVFLAIGAIRTLGRIGRAGGAHVPLRNPFTVQTWHDVLFSV